MIKMTEELKNFYALARRAKDMGNRENAAKYYEMALINDPDNWEANFYTIYFQAMSCKIANIYSAGKSVYSCIGSVLKMVKSSVENAEQVAVVNEIASACINVATMLNSAAVDHYNGIGAEIRRRYLQEMLDRCWAARKICYILGDEIDCLFGNENKAYNKMSVEAWEKGISMHIPRVRDFADKEANRDIIMGYAQKIQKYDPSYETPEIKTGGCYVATAVYGSYDCPQVWTLRRYRDDTLAETWYGRAFVKTYYAISPTLVKWFGNTEWFKKMWKGKLDRMVAKLQSEGVESTPYEDKNW